MSEPLTSAAIEALIAALTRVGESADRAARALTNGIRSINEDSAKTQSSLARLTDLYRDDHEET